MIGGALLLIALLATGAAFGLLVETALAGSARDPGVLHRLAWSRNKAFAARDRWLAPSGPLVAAAAVSAAAVVVPLGPRLVGRDLGIGVFYFIVVIDFAPLAIALTGWGANLERSVESCYRAVAQLVGYVVPLGLAYVGVIMMAGSLSTVTIVEAQAGVPFILLQPIGFALYLVTGLMQCYRAPFLEPFAHDIHGGSLSAVGGWQALLWRFALSALLLLVAAMGAVLYLGGWQGPLLPGWLWMVVKTFALLALMVWLGRRAPLVSTARLLALSWKLLIPIGLVNVLIVGGLILAGVRGT